MMVSNLIPSRPEKNSERNSNSLSTKLFGGCIRFLAHEEYFFRLKLISDVVRNNSVCKLGKCKVVNCSRFGIAVKASTSALQRQQQTGLSTQSVDSLPVHTAIPARSSLKRIGE